MAVDVHVNQARFEAGIPHMLFELTTAVAVVPGPGNRSGSYTFPADAQKFLLSVQPVTQLTNPLNVVLNWTAGLRK